MNDSKGHAKMPRAQRAKQFMPFAALRGYEMLVSEETALEVIKKEITPERQVRISKVLEGLRKGDKVKLIYYEISDYISLEGFVKEVEPVFQWLCIVIDSDEAQGEKEINFSDIWYINKLEI